MADIAAGNVVYTEVAGTRITEAHPPRFKAQISLVFGNNALTYPTGGIPLTASGLSMPSTVESLKVLDQGSNAKGYKFEWVKATNKLRVMVEDTVATNTPLKEHTNATFVPNPATVIVEATGY